MRLRCLGLWLLVGALANLLAWRSARAQGALREGVLGAVWSDPRAAAGQAELRHYLFDRDGRAIQVRLDAALAERFGGLQALRGRRLRVMLDARAGRVGVEAEPVWRIADILDVALDAQAGVAASLDASLRSVRALTLLCEFPDFAGTRHTSLAQVQRLMGDAFPGAQHFLATASGGQLNYDASAVSGWHRLPKPRSEYIVGDGLNTTTAGQDCATEAAASVDFTGIEFVNFIYNVDIGCCFFGGTGALNVGGTLRSYGLTWTGADVASSAGNVFHEIGHSFGLQHSSGPYGLVYDSKWDVMSRGTWYQPPGSEFIVGADINGYGKRRLGWYDDARVVTVQPGTHSYLLRPGAGAAAHADPQLLIIPLPRWGDPATSHYTVEVRDSGPYDQGLPGRGLVIHRVGGGGVSPSNVMDPDGNFEPSDAGAVFEPGEYFEDRVNGIIVGVTERVGDAYRVTVSIADYARITLETPERSLQLPVGSGGEIVDSALVTLAGLPPGTGWTAQVLQTGPTSLIDVSGASGEYLRWRIRPQGFAAGMYAQEVLLRAGTAEERLRVALRLTATSDITVGLAQVSRLDSVITNRPQSGWRLMTLSGPGADTASWTVASSVPWLAVDSVAGRGSRLIGYRREVEGLAPGLHVGTLTITVPAAANPTLVATDSLLVIDPPTWTVTRAGSARAVLPQGGIPVLDSVHVELSGRWATGGQLFASQESGAHYVQPTYPSLIGSGWLRYHRAPGSLPPGVYPAELGIRLLTPLLDTVVLVRDTLVVLAEEARLLPLSPVNRDTVTSIYTASVDSMFIQPLGPNSNSRRWAAVLPHGRLGILMGGGGIPGERTGPAWVHYVRNLDGRAPGWHVDTVRFQFIDGAGGLAGQVIDSLLVRAPAQLALGAASRFTQLPLGGADVVEDSASVSFGDGGGSVAWTASASQGWITLLTPNGAGAGTLRWQRSPAGLGAGWHVDTIAVSALALGSPKRIVDSLYVYAPVQVVSAAARPGAVMGASYADTLRAADGPLAARRWSIVAGALPEGLALDSLTGALSGVAAAHGAFEFTARVSAGSSVAERALALGVSEPVLDSAAVIQAMLGGAALHADLARYLDLAGNRNGKLDVGDVLAWRRRRLEVTP